MPSIAVTRTYLEFPAHLDPAPGPVPDGSRLVELGGGEWERLRQLYRDVGDQWRWHDRRSWSEARWQSYLASPGLRAFVVEVDGRDGGYFELERADDGSMEVALFGLRDFAQGRGLGRWLIAQAVVAARAWGATRVWLHTCTLDSPKALPNYLARGFVPWRKEEYTVEA